MKAELEMIPLGSLCQIKTGKKDVNEGNPSGAYPFFTCAREHTYSDAYSFDGDAILIAGNGDVGNVQIYSGQFEAYQRTYVLMDFDRVMPQYLFHILDGKLKLALFDQKLGNTMPYIKKGMLADFIVPVPPLDQQQRIVAVLDKAFAGIATATANAQTNLTNARMLFERCLRSQFSEPNEGTERRKVGDLIQLQRGFDITKAQQNHGSYPVVSSGGIKSFHSEAMVEGPGVVIGRKGTLGKVFYVESNYWPHDTTLWVKNFHANHPRLIYYMLQCLDVKTLDTGTANPALNRNLVHELDVFWPTQGDQEPIAKRLDRVWNDVQRLNKNLTAKLTALSELKQSLLQKAFAGELS